MSNGNRVFQVRNENKCYNVYICRVTSYVVHQGKMIRKPAFFMKGEPVYVS